MIFICVLVTHLGYAACWNATKTDFEKQKAICGESNACSMIVDVDKKRTFFVHATRRP